MSGIKMLAMICLLLLGVLGNIATGLPEANPRPNGNELAGYKRELAAEIIDGRAELTQKGNPYWEPVLGHLKRLVPREDKTVTVTTTVYPQSCTPVVTPLSSTSVPPPSSSAPPGTPSTGSTSPPSSTPSPVPSTTPETTPIVTTETTPVTSSVPVTSSGTTIFTPSTSTSTFVSTLSSSSPSSSSGTESSPVPSSSTSSETTSTSESSSVPPPTGTTSTSTTPPTPSHSSGAGSIGPKAPAALAGVFLVAIMM